MNDIKNPPFVGANGAFLKNHQTHYNRKKYKREFDRSRLPTPSTYYSEQFKKLKMKSKSKWVSVKCCFHDDNNPSLSINLVSGYFRCFGCGATGRDVLAFHILRYGLGFFDAMTQLGAWRHE